MTTRKKSPSRAAGNPGTNQDPGYAVYRSLIRVVREAPKPAPLSLENESDEEQRRAAAPGVAWGWLQRTLRSGEAAIKLEKSGYGSEAAPLLRAALEHAVRLVWADGGTQQFVEVAMLAKKETSKLTLAAQQHGWRFDDSTAAKLQACADFPTESFSKVSDLKRLAHAVDKSPEEIREQLGSMYMAWLHYTGLSHPTLDTADPYILSAPSGDYQAMLPTVRPGRPADCAPVSCLAAIGAVYGYSRITGLEDYFFPSLQNVLKRHGDYLMDASMP